ncbi:MAG: type sorting protein, partial [Anaeromyxobacteraceae bacterium]|nr:type sorting protein [Anaeromyxobacteraceae bacterium]
GRVYHAADGKGIDDPVAGIQSALWTGRPATGFAGVPTTAWLPWPAERFGAAPNPQETGPDGRAPFYPPPGRYRWSGADPLGVFELYSTPSQVTVGGAVDPDVPLSVDGRITRRIVLSQDPVSGRLNVSEDDVVEWVNADDRPHRVLSRIDPALGTGGWDSGDIPPGGRYRKAFDRLGDYTWTDVAVGGEARIVARKLFVTPEAGTEGTNLVVTDAGFGSGKGKVEVGGTTCKVTSWSDTQVVCTVKEVLPPGIYDVRVIPNKNPEITYAAAFEARVPSLRTVVPAVGKKGTRVRLTGSYWGTKKGTVTVGGKKAKVSSWVMGPTSGDSVIDIKIPKLDPGAQDIVVEAPTGTVTLAGGFTVE